MLTVSKSPESHNKAQSAGSGQVYLPMVGDIRVRAYTTVTEAAPKSRRRRVIQWQRPESHGCQ